MHHLPAITRIVVIWLLLILLGMEVSLGAPLRVLGLSTGAQVYPEAGPAEMMQERLAVPDLLFPNWIMGQFAAEDGYDYIDLAGPMAKQARQTGVSFHGLNDNKGMGHWNHAGNTMVAELLAAQLCEQ